MLVSSVSLQTSYIQMEDDIYRSNIIYLCISSCVVQCYELSSYISISHIHITLSLVCFQSSFSCGCSMNQNWKRYYSKKKNENDIHNGLWLYTYIHDIVASTISYSTRESIKYIYVEKKWWCGGKVRGAYYVWRTPTDHH